MPFCLFPGHSLGRGEAEDGPGQALLSQAQVGHAGWVHQRRQYWCWGTNISGIIVSPHPQMEMSPRRGSIFLAPFESKDLIPMVVAISVGISINPGQCDIASHHPAQIYSLDQLNSSPILQLWHILSLKDYNSHTQLDSHIPFYWFWNKLYSFQASVCRRELGDEFSWPRLYYRLSLISNLRRPRTREWPCWPSLTARPWPSSTPTSSSLTDREAGTSPASPARSSRHWTRRKIK